MNIEISSQPFQLLRPGRPKLTAEQLVIRRDRQAEYSRAYQARIRADTEKRKKLNEAVKTTKENNKEAYRIKNIMACRAYRQRKKEAESQL